MHLRVILVEPLYEGNVGFVAKATKILQHLFKMLRPYIYF